jgi:hypothetical protein
MLRPLSVLEKLFDLPKWGPSSVSPPPPWVVSVESDLGEIGPIPNSCGLTRVCREESRVGELGRSEGAGKPEIGWFVGVG